MPSSFDILSVNRLVEQLKRLNELSFPDIWVEGEVSSVSTPASGHIYFSLKDSDAVLKCVLFKNKRYQAATLPAVGKRILVRGRVSIYSARCELQMIASYIEDAGDGLIRREFDLLKARLKLEGLFEPSSKLALPKFPKKIAVITSQTGAVLHDIIKTTQRRFPHIELALIAVNVQGAKTPIEVIDAISLAERYQADVIIIARGGGSAEDLNGFNDEALAKAIYHCPIPIITGIGHETDFTIADFVADVRAPTPTGAALICLPDRIDLTAQLQLQSKALTKAVNRKLDHHQLNLGYLQRRLISPSDHLRQKEQYLVAHQTKLGQLAGIKLFKDKQQLTHAQSRLGVLSPETRLRRHKLDLHAHKERMGRLLKHQLERRSHKLDTLTSKLKLLDPKATLARGYAIVYDDKGKVVKTPQALSHGDRITAQLADGQVKAKVTKSPSI